VKRAPGAGRPRKPIEVLAMQGTLNVTRHGHVEDYVQSPKGWPEIPEDLAAVDPACVEWWNLVCSHLEGMGVLATSDWLVIRACVWCYYSHTATMKLMSNIYAMPKVLGTQKDPDGNDIIGQNGRPLIEIEWRVNPLAAESRKWLAEAAKYAVQLGLSPTARAGLLRNGPDPKKTGGLEDVLGIADGTND